MPITWQLLTANEEALNAIARLERLYEIIDGYGLQKVTLGDNNGRTRVLEAVSTDETGGSVKIEIGESGNTTISGGKVTASEFVGNLTGNADTATKATQDGSGNIITAEQMASIEETLKELEEETEAAKKEFEDENLKGTPVRTLDMFVGGD